MSGHVTGSWASRAPSEMTTRGNRTNWKAVTDAGQPEHREEAAEPVRYLWPALASLWQAGAR